MHKLHETMGSGINRAIRANLFCFFGNMLPASTVRVEGMLHESYEREAELAQELSNPAAGFISRKHWRIPFDASAATS